MIERFYLPTEIVTGRGAVAQLGKHAARFGRRVLLVCGRRAARAAGLLDRATASLSGAILEVTLFDGVTGEAELAAVQEGLALARSAACEVVVGLGGGSAIDTAKAIAGLAQLSGSVWDYHAGRAVDGPSLPMVAVPTTSGTGAEVTKNAVLIDARSGIKQSIRDDAWFPRVALVDPEVTASMPPTVTAASGADALCQAIEAYTSIGASPVTDALAMRAIALAGRSLARAYAQGDDLDAREDMSMASLLAGMAMSNARLGGVHGMAHPLGSHYGIPHGVVCGLLLPYTMAYNAPYTLIKYAEVARLLGAETAGLAPADAAEVAIAQVRALLDAVAIPTHLGPLGVREEALDPIIAESLPSGSLKHNPRPLGAEDVRAILRAAL
ncbi:MAG: iron-containing alcohol dehydrogenase family protein [Anaerolineae bacterium]